VCANKIPDGAKAEHYFRAALDKDPAYIPALLNMVSTSYTQGNYMSARGYLQRYEQESPYSAESLWLGVRVEYALRDWGASARYALLLRNNFPDTNQAKRLQEWENEHRNR
jgi:type IV pilus assembly protein PilF